MKLDKITLGGGCFWCLSPCFEMLKGVYNVTSGYTGGNTEYPTYEEICTGLTNHAEVIQIEFNPEEISLSELLSIFWYLHDPTQINRQGNDIGTQYRSIILYKNEEQKILSEESLKKYERKELWEGKYVTEIIPYSKFYPAEDYHQKYYEKNSTQPYCSILIAPKIKNIKLNFNNKLKTVYRK